MYLKIDNGGRTLVLGEGEVFKCSFCDEAKKLFYCEHDHKLYCYEHQDRAACSKPETIFYCIDRVQK